MAHQSQIEHDPVVIRRRLARLVSGELLARLLWGESRGELLPGQVAVAAVVMNRVRDGRYGHGIKGVCLRPWQFSCFNNNDPNLPLLLQPPRHAPYRQCEIIAELAVKELLQDPTDGATHYYNPETVPGGWPASWDKSKMVDCGTIGRHSFWRELH